MRIPVQTHVLAARSLPILVLTALVAHGLWTERLEQQRMVCLGELGRLAASTNGLVHELHKERGASAVIIGSQAAQMAQELPTQRLLTDRERAVVSWAIAASRVAAHPDVWAAALARLRVRAA